MALSSIYVDATGMITGTIRDRSGNVFQPTALTITIRDVATGNVINGRNDSALTPIGNYVSSGGAVTIQLTSADNVRYDATKESEAHEVILKFTWGTNSKGYAVAQYSVQRVGSV